MLSWPSRMIVHQPIAIYIAFYIYQKKIFVRGAIRGIDFEKSLLERLSPEGGQNWHKLPSHTSYNMHKSNKNTSLAHHSGRKQGFLSTSPPTLNGLSWPAFKSDLLRSIGSWMPIKRRVWQNHLFSPSGTLLVSYSVIWSSLKYIFVHFFDTLVVEFLQRPQNHPPGSPTHPDKSANSRSTDPNFEIPSKAHESTQKLLRFMSKPEKIRILTFDPPLSP